MLSICTAHSISYRATPIDAWITSQAARIRVRTLCAIVRALYIFDTAPRARWYTCTTAGASSCYFCIESHGYPFRSWNGRVRVSLRARVGGRAGVSVWTAVDAVFAAGSLRLRATAVPSSLQQTTGIPILTLRGVVRANDIGRERTIL